MTSYYSSIVLADSPAVYHDMQETAGTTATDSSGNSRNGSYVNGATVNDSTDATAPVLLGKHVRLDGTDDHVLLNAGSTYLTPATTGLTLEGWFYVRSWSNWMRYFDLADAANATDITFGSNNSGGMFVGLNGTNYYFTPRPSTSAWHHIVLTISAAGQITVYVDAVQVYQTTATAPVNRSRQYKYVGRSAYADPYLQGSVAHVAAYNAVLTSTQVATHYSAGTNTGDGQASGSGTLTARTRKNPPTSYAGYPVQDGAVAYYRVDEGSGTTMSDSSGNGHNGAYNNGATPTATGLLASDATDKALTLDGVDDTAVVAYGSWMAPTTAFSCEFWMKPSTVSGNHFIVGRANYYTVFGNSWGWHFDMAGSTLRFNVFTGDSSTLTQVSWPTALAAGTVYHVVGTYDGTTVRLYVNAATPVAGARTGNMNTAPNVDLTIGAAYTAAANDQQFQGVLDEIAIYHSVLTADQITDHYVVGSTAVPMVTTTPAASGSGALNASTTQIQSTGAAPTGSGALAAGTLQIQPVTPGAAGGGALTATAERYLQAVDAALSGSGALGATATDSNLSTANPGATGDGGLDAVVTAIQIAAPAAGGTGTLSAAVVEIRLVSASLSGGGAAVADLETEDEPELVEAAPALSSEGTLVADVQVLLPGGVRRWVFFDPSNGEQWVFPVNPNKMNSPFPPRNITMAHGTHAGPNRIRAMDMAPSGPASWTFGGVILTRAQHEALTDWASRNRMLRLTDHLGRTFEVVVQNFNPTDRRPTPGRPWRGQYEMTCLALRQVGT